MGIAEDCGVPNERPSILFVGTHVADAWQSACAQLGYEAIQVGFDSIETLQRTALDLRVRAIVPTDETTLAPVAQVAGCLCLPHLLAEPEAPWLAAAQRALSPAGDHAVPLSPLARDVPAGMCEPFWIRSGLCYENACCLRVDHRGDFPLVAQKLRRQAAGTPILLQHAVPGPQYVALLFKCGCDVQGVEIFQQHALSGMYQVPMSWSLPCGLPGRTYALLLDAAHRAGSALPAQHGLFAFTFVIDADHATMIEALPVLQPHPALVAILKAALGIDLYAAILRVALGQAPALSPSRDMAATAQWAESRSGVVVAVEGLAEAELLPGVLHARVGVRPGDRVGHVIDLPSRERSVCVAASGPSRSVVQDTLAHALDLIHVVTRSTVA